MAFLKRVIVFLRFSTNDWLLAFSFFPFPLNYSILSFFESFRIILALSHIRLCLLALCAKFVPLYVWDMSVFAEGTVHSGINRRQISFHSSTILRSSRRKFRYVIKLREMIEINECESVGIVLQIRFRRIIQIYLFCRSLCQICRCRKIRILDEENIILMPLISV